MPPKKKVKTSHDAFSDTQPKTAKGKAKGGKTARRNVRGKRGGLESMPHMPLDVLIEVRRCDTCYIVACLWTVPTM